MSSTQTYIQSEINKTKQKEELRTCRTDPPTISQSRFQFMDLRSSAMFSFNGSMRKCQQSNASTLSTTTTTINTLKHTLTTTREYQHNKTTRALRVGHDRYLTNTADSSRNKAYSQYHQHRQNLTRSPAREMTVFDEQREIEQVLDCVKKVRVYTFRGKLIKYSYIESFLKCISIEMLPHQVIKRIPRKSW